MYRPCLLPPLFVLAEVKLLTPQQVICPALKRAAVTVLVLDGLLLLLQ